LSCGSEKPSSKTKKEKRRPAVHCRPLSRVRRCLFRSNHRHLAVIAAGGIASGTLLSSGAIEVVSSGGLAVSTGIAYYGENTNAGELIISSGGTASSGFFQSGSVEIVASGGTAIGDDIGGHEVVQAGGLARDVTLYDAGRWRWQAAAWSVS
jgi:autotransporter passenger strand-loop-strand repeat protein